MITITKGLYAHRAGTTLILSDQQELPRTTALHPKVLIIAKDHAALKHQLRRWLSGHQLDEIAAALSISRSSAHRLRAAMKITKRDSYRRPP